MFRHHPDVRGREQDVARNFKPCQACRIQEGEAWAEREGIVGMKSNLIQQVKTCGGKYAIALSANANRGKTTILKMFVDSFRRNDLAVMVDMESMGNRKDEMWCFDLDGVKIGIATGGDDASMIDKAFDFFVKNECKIVFCATRYYSHSPSWSRFVYRCANDGYNQDWQGVDAYSLAILEKMHIDIAENVLRKML